jgi:hypothetical protein
VQIGQSEKDFDDIKPRNVLCETPVSLYQSKEFTSGAVLDNENKKLVRFECELHLNQKGMCGILHDVPLIHYDIFLLVLYDHLFIDDLHCIELPIFFESA